MTRARFATGWATSVVAIVVSLVWLHHLGAGDLSAPPLSPTDFRTWLDHSDVAVVAFALVRVVALAMGYYLLAIVIGGGGAQLLSLGRTAALVERVTVPFLRGVLGGAALFAVVPGPSPVVAQAQLASDQVTLHLLPNDPPPAEDHRPPPAPVETATPDDSSWTVQHGECFWSIAREHLSDVLGRDVSDREVDGYWRDVIETNRSRLVNPHDPDLLLTGQVIELPAVASG